MPKSDTEKELDPRELAEKLEVEIDDENRKDLARGSYVDLSWDLMRNKISTEEIKAADTSNEVKDKKLAKETTALFQKTYQKVRIWLKSSLKPRG